MKQITFSGWPESDMQNISFRDYPLLKAADPRRNRYFSQEITGMAAGDYLCMVRGTTAYVGDYSVDTPLSEGEKKLLLLGQEMLILPDKKVVNLQDLTCSTAELYYQAEVSCSLCNRQGEVYTLNYTLPPTNPVMGEYWVDSTVSPAVLRQFGPNERWVTVKDTCIRLQANGIGSYFQVGDGVEMGSTVFKGNTVVRSKGTDYIAVDGIMGQAKTVPVALRRWMPDMDILTVCGDRLWGCRYDVDVNTLYCSSPGDCKNWLPVEVADDAPWRTDVASTGAFTGAAALGETPIFFKEGWLHRVTGSSPGSFRVESIPCSGVRTGCENSLAVAAGKLYYCSATGIMEYSGSGTPRCILSGDFQDAWAGALDGCYFVCLTEDGNRRLLVYDTAQGIWSREHIEQAKHFTTFQGGLYCADGKSCVSLRCPDGDIGPVRWYVESDTMHLEPGELLRRVEVCWELNGDGAVSISFDGGEWETLDYPTAQKGRQVSAVNLRLRPCRHYRLRLDGSDDMTLYSARAETIR